MFYNRFHQRTNLVLNSKMLTMIHTSNILSCEHLTLHHRGQSKTEITDYLKFKWFPHNSSTLLQARLVKKLLMLDIIQLLQKQKKGDVWWCLTMWLLFLEAHSYLFVIHCIFFIFTQEDFLCFYPEFLHCDCHITCEHQEKWQ